MTYLPEAFHNVRLKNYFLRIFYHLFLNTHSLHKKFIHEEGVLIATRIQPNTTKVKVKKSESWSVMSDSLWLMNYTLRGILQARILEWVAFPFSRGSSHLRDGTQVSRIAGEFFTNWATREANTTLYVPNDKEMAVHHCYLQIDCGFFCICQDANSTSHCIDSVH